MSEIYSTFNNSLPLDELKTILLVGGFSESKLLQEGIQRHFPSIAVRTPSEPSTAVVKGAVDFGHCPEKIRFRMSPYTYGINMTIPFRHGVQMVYEQQLRGNVVEFLLVTIYSPKTLQPGEWFSTQLMASQTSYCISSEE
jgi:hypothetical protein